MWRRLPRDDRHKTVPARRRSSFWKETAYDPEFLGAGTRQACDLEGVGAGARQLSPIKILDLLMFLKKTTRIFPMRVVLVFLLNKV